MEQIQECSGGTNDLQISDTLQVYYSSSGNGPEQIIAGTTGIFSSFGVTECNWQSCVVLESDCSGTSLTHVTIQNDFEVFAAVNVQAGYSEQFCYKCTNPGMDIT